MKRYIGQGMGKGHPESLLPQAGRSPWTSVCSSVWRLSKPVCLEFFKESNYNDGYFLIVV